MKSLAFHLVASGFVCLLAAAGTAQAQTLPLIAVGTLDQSSAGSFSDLSGLTYPLENGVLANELGGMGSALAYAGGDTFLALPDRGPNANEFNDAVDNTVSYVNRFHTVTMDLWPNTSGSGLPFMLMPHLDSTTLLWSAQPLVYGTGEGLGIGSGVPPINKTHARYYFTGRSDNFDAAQNSGDPMDARFDTEGLRVSNDGEKVFISDEYGPYIYEFNRNTGKRLHAYKLPDMFYVKHPAPVGDDEISGNTAGRTANKGMEGLAITPDGKTLVGIMQNALIQDAAEGGDAANLLRIVTIDIASGRVMHQFGYLLTNGSGVSEILALNEHEFLVDERKGKGLGDGSKAKVKQLFKIDLNGATDVGDMDGTAAAAHAVSKTLFVDLVDSLVAAGYSTSLIPSKIEGIAIGPDVKNGGKTVHTLWVANDNDFLESVADPDGNIVMNPNEFFVFAFTDADLDGSLLMQQKFAKKCK
ncbi:MAG TPA: esterase-like activity of phytase family protein [Terracidiphilus sp.]|nr:esterase-like activity of phytase family protein [Terracidiphilus sp.]